MNRILAHNLIAHPIAGVLWWLGGLRPDGTAKLPRLVQLGDAAHGWWQP